MPALPLEVHKEQSVGLEGDTLYMNRGGSGMVVMKTREQEEGTVSFLQGIQWDQANARISSLTILPIKGS